MAAHRVNLVNENNAGRILLPFLEKVPDPRSADADIHFDEIGAADGIEGDPGLPGDCLGQQGLASTRFPVEKHSGGDARPGLGEFGRIFEKIDDFGNFFLNLVSKKV